MRIDERSWQEKVRQDGFAIVPNVLSTMDGERLIDAVQQENAGTRHERQGNEP